MKATCRCFVLISLSAFFFLNASAGDKVTVRINNQTVSVWRVADLDSAKKEAAAERKPIAWVASDLQYLDGTGQISTSGSRGATLHALYALRNRTIMVFEDGPTENHKVLQFVDDAIHKPKQHWDMPIVIFLNPEVTEVLATVTFEPDFVKRAHALADGLSQTEEKMKSETAAGKK
ncbi:MAG TPA: hypothetical protein VHG89_01335 [Verrucomicrobiae bacterium]|nr:hypothetical protein [Verrucomicrobiae bacterium]